MTTTTPAVQEFFDQYAQSRSALDIDLIASQYTDSIMFAGPNGTRVAEKPAILAAFPKGQEFLKAHGHKSTKVLSLDETRLDDHYVLVRARFVWRFEKSSAQPIDVEVASTFILYINDGVPKIVFQHEPEEFQQALRARGVLPATP
jgi:ketosteroid isomerase-like protein